MYLISVSRAMGTQFNDCNYWGQIMLGKVKWKKKKCYVQSCNLSSLYAVEPNAKICIPVISMNNMANNEKFPNIIHIIYHLYT